MPSPRVLLHLLLALVLVLNLGVPAASATADRPAVGGSSLPIPDTGDSARHAGHDAPAPCHGAATDATPSAPATAPMDCCDGGACTCSCLHHAPLALLPALQFAALPHPRVVALGRSAWRESVPAAPDIRPPIA